MDFGQKADYILNRPPVRHKAHNVAKMLFHFVWKNKTHYIKKSVIMKSYNRAGHNFLDFHTQNNTFKINL